MTTKKKNEVATLPEGCLLPANYDYGEDADGGLNEISGAEESLPFIKVLQPLSPEVVPGDAQIEGAAAGMFYNTGTGELFDKITFVPAIRKHEILEWVPRNKGGGLADRTEVKGGEYPAFYKDAMATAEKFGKFTAKNGNQLKETFTVFGVQIDDEGNPIGMIVVPFQSTGIGPYKKQFIRPLRATRVNGRRPPMWAHRVVLTTTSQTNDEGTWFNYVIGFPVENSAKLSLLPADHAASMAAKELNGLVTEGTVSADLSGMQTEGETGDSDPF